MGFQYTITDHLLQPARRIESPNQSDRDDVADISLLVLHNISLPPGEFGGCYIDDLFCNCLDQEIHPFFREIARLRVSAHLLIDRNGSVTQYVPFHRKAWHAGESCFEGRINCNDFSIGIELEGTDNECFTQAQYSELINICKLLMHEYPAIESSRIVGHCDIAPQRKTDPGPCFDWEKLKVGLTADNRTGD